MRKAGQRPLTPDDWAGAALAAIARGGVDAVAVETVAAKQGATKGSFYWHFKNRDALIQAALDMWEQRGTEAVIEEFEREPDPAVRLKKILEAGFEVGPTDRAEIAVRLRTRIILPRCVRCVGSPSVGFHEHRRAT